MYGVQYGTTRICFISLADDNPENSAIESKDKEIPNCKLVYELYMGRHGLKGLISSFCSMSLDPEEKCLLVSGYQEGNFESSIVQALSLEKTKFCRILAS